MSDVSRILSSIEQDDPSAAEQLLPLVYDELRKLAAQKLAQEKPGQTLQATALVHEAYVRLVAVEKGQCWEGRGHFFAAAAEAMRRILVENVRHKRSQKAGHGRQRLPLDDIEATAGAAPDDLLALDEALTKLGGENQEAADLAKLRLFTGLTVDDAADALRVSRRTGFRLWIYGRAFLQAELSADESSARCAKENARAVALDAAGFHMVFCIATHTGAQAMSSRESEAARIFLDAVEHHQCGQWTAFAREAAAGEPLVLRRVDALLKAHGEPDLDQ